jgi:hypothetical protein
LEELVADEAVLQRLLAPLGGSKCVSAAATADNSPQQQQCSSPTAAAAVNGVQKQLSALTVSSGSNAAAAAAAAAAASGSSGSVWRDPDDGVREALAEAIAVLVSGWTCLSVQHAQLLWLCTDTVKCTALQIRQHGAVTTSSSTSSSSSSS